MPTKIKVDSAPYQEKLITLNGQSMYIRIMYNTSDDVDSTEEGSWYFDLADRNKEDIINGIKIMPAKNLTSRYLTLNTLLGGALWCANTKDTVQNLNRDNFYTDGKFQLWYYSDAEMVALGIEDL